MKLFTTFLESSIEQSVFEALCHNQFGLGRGVLSIRHDGLGYVNEHVQWLWVQYLKANQ